MKALKNTKQFVLRYYPKGIMTPVAARYAGVETHPLRPKILHMYANRDPNTLWWKVSVNHLPLKKVVRSWAARRVRSAFREALKERGFDHEGRCIVQEGSSSSQTAGLKGTADIIVNQCSIREESAAVQEEMASLVDTLVRVAQGQSCEKDFVRHRKPLQHAGPVDKSSNPDCSDQQGTDL
jgi:hypothetical protein